MVRGQDKKETGEREKELSYRLNVRIDEDGQQLKVAKKKEEEQEEEATNERTKIRAWLMLFSPWSQTDRKRGREATATFSVLPALASFSLLVLSLLYVYVFLFSFSLLPSIPSFSSHLPLTIVSIKGRFLPRVVYSTRPS